MKAETVKFTTEVKIADSDGVPIREGSVLREINDGERGVVTRIVRAGDRGTAFDCVGDVHIQKGPGTTRVTNRYNQWRHIPHNEQTYDERFRSWLRRPEYPSDRESISNDEARAIDGIMALLPDDIVDYDYGPFHDTLEDALKFLAEHLEQTAGKLPKETPAL